MSAIICVGNDKAINSATRAIWGQAETQPSSNTGAAFAHRGFSKDTKIFKAILEGVDVDTQYTNIYSAISDYRMAIQLGYSYANIAVRIKILQALLPVELDEKASCAELEERISKLEFEYHDFMSVYCSPLVFNKVLRKP